MSTTVSEVKMDLQVERMSPRMNGDGLSRLNGISTSSGSSSSGSSGILNLSCGGGSEDSSEGDERPIIPPPKKNRLQEQNNNTLLNLSNGRLTTSLAASLALANGRKETLNNHTRSNGNNDNDTNCDDDEENDIDVDVDDDEDGHEEPMTNGRKGDEGQASSSFTSGENSDVEGGDETEQINMKQDESKKLFECDICNMTFSNGANMRRHRMRHTGVKPYECRVCQKRFFRKDHLAEHMATHSKLLPFRCPICNKGFQRQIAMRAHFQNEHVGGSQEMVKACPLCAYKAGSMKSLRVHFYSRHGIDLDNPIPNSPTLCSNSNGGSPGPSNCTNGGEYSELAHALGFEDRDKSNDSSSVNIPSHFLVPQIEIQSNSPYPPNFPFTAESNYNFAQDDRHCNVNGRCSSPLNVSPQSNDSRSSVNISSSSADHLVVVKKEILDDSTDPSTCLTSKSEVLSEDNIQDIQEAPEDYSLKSAHSTSNSKNSSSSASSLIKISPLKSLLREDYRASNKESSNLRTVGGGGGGSSSSSTSSNSSSKRTRDKSRDQESSTNQKAFSNESFDGEPISSSDTAAASFNSRSSTGYPAPQIHQCVFCGIIFPDKTLYFLHKGCHSDSNPWRCNICGECCNNVYDFNSHLLSKSHQ